MTRRVALLALAAQLSLVSMARAGDPFYIPPPAQNFVCESELIVVAKVTRVYGWFQWRKAEADVEAVWAGAPLDKVVYRTSYGLLGARPTEVGERAVLFLERAPDEELWWIALQGDGCFEVPGTSASPTLRLPRHVITLPDEEPTYKRAYDPPALVPLREFREIVQRLRENHVGAVTAARSDVLAMRAEERRAVEAARAGGAPESEALAVLRARHTERFADRRSWRRESCDPVRHLGAEALTAMFELLRQVDDATVRRAWCDTLESAARRGELPPEEVARFIDAARVAVGEPQWFGTYYALPGALADEASDSAMLPAALESTAPASPNVDRPTALDFRRRELGLRPWLEVERERAAAEAREVLPQPNSPRDEAPDEVAPSGTG